MGTRCLVFTPLFLIAALTASAQETLQDRDAALQRAEPAVAEAAKVARQDPNRPIYHVQPPAQWNNDPNGPIFHDGRYHLFYQHNPYDAVWGHMHWGHVSSPDLANWKHEPIALWPSLKLGEEHCFSGCAIALPGERPAILYTSIGPKMTVQETAQQWLAWGNDDLRAWEKDADNPIMAPEIHGDLKVREWRDPYVWKDEHGLHMVLGGQLEDGKGAALYYTGTSLKAWTFKSILFEEPEAGRGGSWECPNFFKLGDKWVLIISRDGVRYWTGDFDREAGRFIPQHTDKLDHGPSFYAPNGCFDSKGRHILWGWVTGVAGEKWNGMLTVPRVLTLKEGVLHQEPAPELEKLRGKHRKFSRLRIEPDESYEVEEAVAGASEIIFTLTPEDSGAVVVRLTTSTVPGAQLNLELNWSNRQLNVGDRHVPLPDTKEPLIVRVLLDNSVAELFVAGKTLTVALPKTQGQPLTLSVLARGDAQEVANLQLWDLGSIWES